MSSDSYAGDLTPQQAWKILTDDRSSVLIDCRTGPEWDFVGVPDLSALDKEVVFLPWRIYPDMRPNPNFAAQIQNVSVNKDTALLIICRSGARSRSAAIAITALGYERAYNVSEGFEGGLDPNGHRSTHEGWKVAGLPWVQK